MNEDRFRDRFHRALGSPPGIDRSAIERVLSGHRRPSHRLALGSLSASAVLLLVGAFAGWRLVDQRLNQAAKPSPASSTKPTHSALASGGATACSMPVVVWFETGPPMHASYVAGFLDTGSGRFTADPTASVSDLPGGNFPGTSVKPSQPSHPTSYSDALHRWLPVDAGSVSPDGRSYIWERLLPPGSNASTARQSEIQVYDVPARQDRVLWVAPGSTYSVNWDAAGIRIVTTPPNGSDEVWLLDPVVGSATRLPAPTPRPRLTQLPGDPLVRGAGFGYEDFGTTFQGHPIYRIGGRDPGSPEIVIIETAPGQRVIIYKGSQGDATGFDPSYVVSDGTGIWFFDYEGKVIWRWEPTTGLRKIMLTGMPSPPSGPNPSAFLTPGGPCR